LRNKTNGNNYRVFLNIVIICNGKNEVLIRKTPDVFREKARCEFQLGTPRNLTPRGQFATRCRPQNCCGDRLIKIRR